MSRPDSFKPTNSESLEARWFATNPPPSQERIEARRGFYRPPTSNGLMFACVSLLLVALAITSTLFFSRPDSKHEPISSATLTSAEPITESAQEPVKTITTKDLPSVPYLADP